MSDDVFRRDHGYSCQYVPKLFCSVRCEKGKSRPFFAPRLLFASNFSGVHSMASLHKFMQVCTPHTHMHKRYRIHASSCMPQALHLTSIASYKHSQHNYSFLPTYLSAIIGGPPACSIPSFLSVSPDYTRDLDLKFAHKSY